jgi:superfamily II RNA helicase
MDVNLEHIESMMEPKWIHFGRRRSLPVSEKALERIMKDKEQFDAKVESLGGNSPVEEVKQVSN